MGVGGHDLDLQRLTGLSEGPYILRGPGPHTRKSVLAATQYTASTKRKMLRKRITRASGISDR